MYNVKNIYFVDYENVNCHGMEGIDKLNKDDLVYVFYSKNAKTINIDYLQVLKNTTASYKFIEIKDLGDNALDFQMCTIIGVIIGKYIGKELCINIISCDNGYNAITNINKLLNAYSIIKSSTKPIIVKRAKNIKSLL